jgi:translation elongation factor EF-4
MSIIPVLTKIDLPHAQPESVAEDMCAPLTCPSIAERLTYRSSTGRMLSLDVDIDAILRVSSKTGAGVDKVFKRIVETVPPPIGSSLFCS